MFSHPAPAQAAVFSCSLSITLLAITVPLAPFCGWVIQNKTFKQSAQSHGRLNCCSENSTA